ncbi:hypothetical protein RDV89_07605 [Nocardioides zeae]|uniref:Uncharacterized protein n=1 Tax=Nocardioides imazamoxiresistens TaxID=3231893 RepID=A0ABU3PUL5_9ACTN|nr:hypothetical protein [Nocardioides zeae]MDT9592929.1 hypothetical protein [Nocardioides zeae]
MSIPVPTAPVPAAFRDLVDDAAVFPPGEAPLPSAVTAHAAHLRAPHAPLVGPFVVGAPALPEVARLVDTETYSHAPMRVSVVVASPDAVPDAVGAVQSADGLDLAALEVKLPPAARPFPATVPTIAAAAPRGVLVYVEMPRPGDPAWTPTADAVARHGLRMKFRTGGVRADLFPSEWEVATWIEGAVSRGVAFKCTAGLHNAVRHTDPRTGFEHHGYLNVLLATLLATDGAPLDATWEAVAERRPDRVAAAVGDASPDALARARRSFASYGSCSVTEPYDDLVALGLLERPTAPETPTDEETP